MLFEEFGEDKTSEILRKSFIERSEERAIAMRERAHENGDELIADNIISTTDVPFLGWVPEFEEFMEIAPIDFWLLRFEKILGLKICFSLL